MAFHRCSLLACVLSGSVLFAAQKPNIVLLLTDDLGYGELGCQGFIDEIPTPHIDSIAKNGVRFTDGYVSCPVCSPSRAGLLTGRYQNRFGYESNPGNAKFATVKEQCLPPSEKTIAERLKPLGYTSAIFGKWHLGDKTHMAPSARGFDEGGGKKHNFGYEPSPANKSLFITEKLGRESVAFIERHKNEPFFLYVSFHSVHAPVKRVDPYYEDLGHIQDEKRRQFASMLVCLDVATGSILTKLRKTGLEENTLIVFLGDNGACPATTCLSKPLNGMKRHLYEGGIRVPFMVQWKGELPAGKLYHEPVIALDLLPTFIAAAGGQVSPDWQLDGVNLLPYLNGQRQGAPHPILYWRFMEQQAVRQGPWKWVVPWEKTEPELYHLGRDISEQRNLIDQKPEKAKELEAAFMAWSDQLPEPYWLWLHSRSYEQLEHKTKSSRRFLIKK